MYLSNGLVNYIFLLDYLRYSETFSLYYIGDLLCCDAYVVHALDEILLYSSLFLL